MKIYAIPLLCIFLVSSPALAQALPECPPESQNIEDFSLAHLDLIMSEYKESMESRGLVIESLLSELKATGRWDKTSRRDWDRETKTSPDFMQSVKAMNAAQAAEDPALIAFITAMNGPREAACQAMARYFQTKLDFFAENYKQLDIAERTLRTRKDAIQSSGSPR